MSPIQVASDQQSIFIALEDNSGNPVVIKTTLSDLTTFTKVYDPLDGTAVNVKAAPNGVMYFYGDFGTDVKVISHDVESEVNTDISPPSLGTDVVNTLDVNPANEQVVLVGVNTSQVLLETVDGGANWTTLNAALGLDITTLLVLWSNVARILTAGFDGARTKLFYSVDTGATFVDIASTDLHAAGNVVSLAVKNG